MSHVKETYHVVLAEGPQCKIIWTGWGVCGSISLHRHGRLLRQTVERSPRRCAKYLNRVNEEPFNSLLRAQEDRIEDFLCLKERQRQLELSHKLW